MFVPRVSLFPSLLLSSSLVKKKNSFEGCLVCKVIRILLSFQVVLVNPLKIAKITKTAESFEVKVCSFSFVSLLHSGFDLVYMQQDLQLMNGLWSTQDTNRWFDKRVISLTHSVL